MNSKGEGFRKTLRVLLVAVCVVGALWMLCKWVDYAEENAELKRLAEEAEAEHAEEVEAAYEEGEEHGWNMLLKIIKNSPPEYDFSSFIHPQDLREETADGYWTTEDLLDLYEEFFYEMYDAINEDPEEWAEYCDDVLEYRDHR